MFRWDVRPDVAILVPPWGCGLMSTKIRASSTKPGTGSTESGQVRTNLADIQPTSARRSAKIKTMSTKSRRASTKFDVVSTTCVNHVDQNLVILCGWDFEGAIAAPCSSERSKNPSASAPLPMGPIMSESASAITSTKTYVIRRGDRCLNWGRHHRALADAPHDGLLRGRTRRRDARKKGQGAGLVFVSTAAR